jgi:hypothetical protein
MLGSDKSRGYCLEMICADLLAGAHGCVGDPDILLESLARCYELLEGQQEIRFISRIEKENAQPVAS